MVSYVPGGWLADRFPARRLMSASLVISGLGGLVFARLPSYAVCLLLYGLWGISVGLIFWAAMIKATRHWGGEHGQGKAFGILEGGRSLSDVGSSAVFLACFAWLGANTAALASMARLTAWCLLVMAVLVWLVLKDRPASGPRSPATQPAFSWSQLRLVLGMPVLWLLSLVILTTNWGMWGTIYFTPYATDIYGLGEVWGGAIGGAKYGLAAVAAVTAGLVADRLGAARTVVGLFLLMTAGFLLFAIVPGRPGRLALLLVNSALIATTVFALRGIYYALLEQGGIPMALTGTAVGMVSVIGYTPDTLAPLVFGRVLDAWPGAEGFRILFLIISGLCVLGLLASVAICRLTRDR
jgi:nitrate/nitrite transporter NarK